MVQSNVHGVRLTSSSHDLRTQKRLQIFMAYTYSSITIRTLGVWLWIFEMCLIDGVVGNAMILRIGWLFSWGVCLFVWWGCEAVLVRKRPRDCG
jgi:hypothetical protein